jgi:hypothetical protein
MRYVVTTSTMMFTIDVDNSSRAINSPLIMDVQCDVVVIAMVIATGRRRRRMTATDVVSTSMRVFAVPMQCKLKCDVA